MGAERTHALPFPDRSGVTMRLWSSGVARGVAAPVIGKLTSVPRRADEGRSDYIAFGASRDLVAFRDDWSGYAGLLCTEPLVGAPIAPLPGVYGPPHLEYLETNDVVQLAPTGVVNVL